MTKEQRKKLIQEEYDAKQKTHGGDRRSFNFSSGENLQLKKDTHRMQTRPEIAQEHGITEGEVKSAVEFGRGLDRASEVDPSFKNEVLTGKLKASERKIAEIRKLKDDEAERTVHRYL